MGLNVDAEIVSLLTGSGPTTRLRHFVALKDVTAVSESVGSNASVANSHT